MPEDRDDLFAKLCVQLGYLTPQQLADARASRVAAEEQLGMSLGLADVAVSKKLLTPEQREEVMRLVRIQTGEARTVGGHEVLAKIGEGGMGVVYKARSAATGEVVALKVLPPSLARSAALLKRFRREAEAARALHHSNIVRFIEFGLDREKKLYYCALEFVEGEDLASKVQREGSMSEEEALSIAREVALALEHASSRGLVHRDVKPQNVMMTPGGTAKLLDLGLARSVSGGDTRLTQAGMFIGSPHYASPEQAQGMRDIDVRSDIYSLGATLYYMVTSRTPFSGLTAAAVLSQVVSGSLPWPAEPNPELSEGACRLIEKMMARDPADRYARPAELARDIDVLLAGGDAPMEPLVAGKSVIARPARGAKRLAAADRMAVAAGRAAPGRGPGATPHAPARDQAAGGHAAAYVAVGAGLGAVALVALFMVYGPGEAEPPPPTDVASRPVPLPRKEGPSQAELDRERRLEDMLEFAKKYREEHPDEFDRAASNFERARDAARGTRFELIADSRAQEIRKDWKRAAVASLDAAKAEALNLAGSGNFDGALAKLQGIPKHLASQIEGEARAEAGRIRRDADRRIAQVFASGLQRLAAGDSDGALEALSALDRIRFAEGKAKIAAKVESVFAQIATAEETKEVAAAKKAREGLPALLDEFEKLVDSGDYAAARKRMAAAAVEAAFAPIAGTLGAVERVAVALERRQRAVVAAARRRIGETVALQTAKGLRKGEVEKVDEKGIALAAKVIINRQPRGVRRFVVAWTDLAPEAEDRLAAGWRPAGAEGGIVLALVALKREDPDAAEKALASAGEHPFAEAVRRKIDGVRLGEVEGAALAAWRQIERRSGKRKLSAADRKEILTGLDAFQKDYGETKLAASVAAKIAAVRRRVAEAGVRWTSIPAGQIRVALLGGARSSVVGDTLVVTVPPARGSHARVPLLSGCADFRLKFEYRGPMLEMFLRKAGWRGCILAALTRDSIGVRTYAVEDQNRPQVLTLNKGRDVLPDGWHAVEIALKGSSFTYSVDRKPVTKTDTLPALASGDSYILVWPTRGEAFQLRNVSYAVFDKLSGTVDGILLVKSAANDWIDVKADEERFATRYVPLDDARGRPDRKMIGAIRRLFGPNRVRLVWKLVAGQRRIVALEMIVPAEKSGSVTGAVTDKGLGWIEVKPDDGPPERYLPRWMGGMPAAGGGFEKPVLAALGRIRIGDRVKLDWIYDVRKRVVKIGLAAGSAAAGPQIAPGVKFRDAFEKSTCGWSIARMVPAVVGDVSCVQKTANPREGKVLALKYTLEPGKMPVMARTTRDINRLRLSIRTVNRPAELIIVANEEDGSSYSTGQHLEPRDGWKRLDLDLALFRLGNDSKDENGALDFDQIRGIVILDAGTILGRRGDNVVLMDDVVGEYRTPPE